MKSVLICVVVALAFYVTSSQLTCDVCRELEELNQKIDKCLGTTTDIPPVTSTGIKIHLKFCLSYFLYLMFLLLLLL